MATRFTHAIVAKIIREQKPRGWTVLERESGYRDPLDLSSDTEGKCHYDEKIISVRPIVNLFQLHVFLHEVAHAKFHSRESSLQGYQEEYEAEIWAFRVMRSYGFRIPRELTKEARANVLLKMKSAKPPLNARVRRWARYSPSASA